MKAAADPAQGAPTRTLQRGLHVLEALASESDDHGMGLTDVAELVELDKATASRLLQTLCALGYAYQDPYSRLYKLTGKLLSLGESYRANLDLPRRMAPFLADLRDLTGETVHLGTQEGGRADRMVYIAKLETALPVQIASAIGQTMPMHTTALGKAVLASLAEQEFERRLGMLVFERRTDRTIVDTALFRREIHLTRERGYSIDDRENEDAVTCVGSALLDGKGQVVGAISVSGPTYRTGPRIDEIGRQCREAADRARDLL